MLREIVSAMTDNMFSSIASHGFPHASVCFKKTMWFPKRPQKTRYLGVKYLTKRAKWPTLVGREYL
jgi:hypothetical protein